MSDLERTRPEQIGVNSKEAEQGGQPRKRAERRSEPVHIREILPEVMAKIAARMDGRAKRDA